MRFRALWMQRNSMKPCWSTSGTASRAVKPITLRCPTSDARQAIPILQSDRQIDLMVSDVVLPHINGRKLAEIARAARPDLKILFVTGYAEHATFRGGFLEPGMDMLTKPFALDALGAKVRAMIER
jgi:DNA-binding response OmpR family regulator